MTPAHNFLLLSTQFATNCEHYGNKSMFETVSSNDTGNIRSCNCKSVLSLLCLVADEEDVDEDTEALLAADFEIGHFIRERVVPRAVLYFTGEALEDDDVSPFINVI